MSFLIYTEILHHSNRGTNMSIDDWLLKKGRLEYLIFTSQICGPKTVDLLLASLGCLSQSSSGCAARLVGSLLSNFDTFAPKSNKKRPRLHAVAGDGGSLWCQFWSLLSAWPARFCIYQHSVRSFNFSQFPVGNALGSYSGSTQIPETMWVDHIKIIFQKDPFVGSEGSKTLIFAQAASRIPRVPMSPLLGELTQAAVNAAVPKEIGYVVNHEWLTIEGISLFLLQWYFMKMF